ncbi:AGAP010182-PA-like protein [Anopheles sinensis]|uniref:AGAP010182-PA-like protein n=1 Tax=Anopheles sinensis TaxID=74873 RepID=A0A084WPY5_ANOSI|nr:AGAP010182-PA-like protein [Anopheles sinensis]
MLVKLILETGRTIHPKGWCALSRYVTFDNKEWSTVHDIRNKPLDVDGDGELDEIDAGALRADDEVMETMSFQQSKRDGSSSAVPEAVIDDSFTTYQMGTVSVKPAHTDRYTQTRMNVCLCASTSSIRALGKLPAAAETAAAAPSGTMTRRSAKASAGDGRVSVQTNTSLTIPPNGTDRCLCFQSVVSSVSGLRAGRAGPSESSGGGMPAALRSIRPNVRAVVRLEPIPAPTRTLQPAVYLRPAINTSSQSPPPGTSRTRATACNTGQHSMPGPSGTSRTRATANSRNAGQQPMPSTSSAPGHSKAGSSGAVASRTRATMTDTATAGPSGNNSPLPGPSRVRASAQQESMPGPSRSNHTIASAREPVAGPSRIRGTGSSGSLADEQTMPGPSRIRPQPGPSATITSAQAGSAPGPSRIRASGSSDSLADEQPMPGPSRIRPQPGPSATITSAQAGSAPGPSRIRASGSATSSSQEPVAGPSRIRPSATITSAQAASSSTSTQEPMAGPSRIREVTPPSRIIQPGAGFLGLQGTSPPFDLIAQVIVSSQEPGTNRIVTRASPPVVLLDSIAQLVASGRYGVSIDAPGSQALTPSGPRVITVREVIAGIERMSDNNVEIPLSSPLRPAPAVPSPASPATRNANTPGAPSPQRLPGRGEASDAPAGGALRQPRPDVWVGQMTLRERKMAAGRRLSQLRGVNSGINQQQQAGAPPIARQGPIARNDPRLLFYAEESLHCPRYFIEPSFSPDGRVICSPYSGGARLLMFNEQCAEPQYAAESLPKALCELKFLGPQPRYVVCTQFSPRMPLVVTGCLDGEVLFHPTVL